MPGLVWVLLQIWAAFLPGAILTGGPKTEEIGGIAAMFPDERPVICLVTPEGEGEEHGGLSHCGHCLAPGGKALATPAAAVLPASHNLSGCRLPADVERRVAHVPFAGYLSRAPPV